MFDAAAIRDVLDSDRIKQHFDFKNQSLVIVVRDFHDDYMYDVVSNVSKCEVVASLAQSCASGVAKSYVSCDECEVADPKF